MPLMSDHRFQPEALIRLELRSVDVKVLVWYVFDEDLRHPAIERDAC